VSGGGRNGWLLLRRRERRRCRRVRDHGGWSNFWRRGRKSWLCLGRRRLCGRCERFRLEWRDRSWRFLRQRRLCGNDWRRDRYRRDGNRRRRRLGGRWHFDARRDRNRRRNSDMWIGSRNGDGLTRLGSDGLLSDGRWGRSGRSDLGLEFPDDALQSCDLFRVFLGQVVDLFAKSGLPNK
jgi:hypothetical protein